MDDIKRLLTEGKLEDACREILMSKKDFGDISTRHAQIIRSAFAALRFADNSGGASVIQIKPIKPIRKKSHLRIVRN